MDNTGRFELPLLMPSQAQKHVTHNEALTLIDALLHPAIKTFGDSAPPPSFQIDDAFYVGPSATGDWFGQSGKIAVFTDMGWRFANVRDGMLAHDLGADAHVKFTGASWEPLGSGGGAAPTTLPQLGINTGADLTNKLSVRSNAALLSALFTADGGNGDMRLTLNKETAGDTGSLVFQSGWSGRAEFGLAGDDNFHVKVSPDGSVWSEAITVNGTSGQVTLAGNSVANAALADMAPGTFKGRADAGIGDPQDISGAQATALLDTFTTSAKGLAPASGSIGAGYLKADGSWGLPAPGEGTTGSPQRFYAFHECLNNPSDPLWLSTVSGTGAVHSNVAFGDPNSAGALRSVLGTTAAGRTSIASPFFNGLLLGNGFARAAARFRIITLSDAVNTFVLRCGFIDSITGEPVDGAYFRYTDSVNGGRFQAVTRSNNVETAVDTGIAGAINANFKLEVEANANATSVAFRINGAPVATITTTIPKGAGRETGYGMSAIRSAGTASLISHDIDYLLAEQLFTTAR
ncbi:MAG: DUF2793 domain-containing protein [Rhizobiaceae bacterium]